MPNTDATALAKRLTVAEVLALRERVQAAAQEFVAAAQKLAALAEPIGCDFEEITSSGYRGRLHPRHSIEVLSSRSCESEDKIMRFFDLRAWDFLISLTGVYKVMNSAKQRELDEQFQRHESLPALTVANVEATLRGLVNRSHEMMVDGIVDLMQKLSWDYKTNTPCVLEPRFIIKGAIDKWGFGGQVAGGVLDDLDRVLFLLRGVERPGTYDRWFARLSPVRGHTGDVVGAHFTVKTHKNGNGHVLVHEDAREYLAEINRLVAMRYPMNLPPQRQSATRKGKKVA